MLLTLICMIPKVNLGVEEMAFMFCDLALATGAYSKCRYGLNQVTLIIISLRTP